MAESTTPEALDLRRRSFLIGGAALLTGFALAPTATLAAAPAARDIWLYNINTGEKFRGEYWRKGSGYLKDALHKIDHVLRDHHNGKIHKIDPELVDLLNRLSRKIGASRPFEVICGYRSPETNAALAKRSRSVAKKSLHMEGMAIDLRLPGTKLSSLRKAAVSLKGGGVGYYPRNNFVHLDTGDVRIW